MVSRAACLCDRQAVAYARERIPPELQTHPYRCRFIDTTTAAPWRECYHPDHPMTRTESRECKMDLLRYVSDDRKLVTRQRDGPRRGGAVRALLRGHAQPRARTACRTRAATCCQVVDERAGARGQVPDRPRLSAAAVGAGVSRLRRGPVVLGRLQQQAARALGRAAICGTPCTARRRCSCSTASFGSSNRERFVQSYQVATPVVRGHGLRRDARPPLADARPRRTTDAASPTA